jgi:tripartite-type tricarboxylate transporter receptor subunit TctC
MPTIPTVLEIANTAEGRAALAFYIGGAQLGRSLVAPPGMSADRVKVLRAAFMAMLKDRDFQAEIEKSGQEFYPASGEEVQKLILETADAPRDVVDLVAKILRTK